MEPRRTRFYLDKRNSMVMGVCAGIADYTGIDLLLVRVGFVLINCATGFFGGFGILAYFLVGWLANDKPHEFDYEDREDRKFWQKVRARPGNSVRDVRARFRDIDRRIADVELHLTSHNRRLADEIEALR
ncbi:envelope stress response membrane protein PspC [Sphingomonas nostoxanthinifaciens]|uniref:envelope stress response membrane protein PspC n=1 Tax=Sphingomonas nostoxanthinifaciens TaxID=2872652 RepID=UPI001CC1E688|nr:envelope stress response membrane protein PspC [Sphingomonas nostoxanthinifaciens]UAK26012.1 envelope stress response membrane protein PspC [Sphingomonas nostoxanthinifaciens]